MQSEHRQAMSELCESFPTLRGKPGVDPWDQERLDHWAATSGAVTSGSLLAAQFCLGVWCGSLDHEWECGKFDLFRAIGIWDAEHKQAFQDWLDDPFYP